ncbi:MAG: BMP family ABC transporter substrate-binding protein [Selenomonadaceae bacterium]|nr:BMP family ABC transporter substrate-binding protein [Selenomonadaceae bacterium]
MSEKNSVDENLSRRFYILNTCVTILLLATIFISINQFGTRAWSGWSQVALIIPGERNRVGWDRSQYLAVKNVCDHLDYDFILRENASAMDYASNEKIVEELSRRGVKNIFFTNGLKLTDLKTLEKKYPTITFCTIEIISALWTGGRYSILSFEGSYLAGILAGLHTQTNKIGYVAPYQNSEVNQGINAFTMGVKRVNPDAEILLDWTNDWDNKVSEEQAVQNLKAARVDVLTYHQNSDAVPNACKRLGINFIAFNEVYPQNKYCLASIRIDWKKVYNDLITYRSSYAMNYQNVYGVAQGVVSLEIAGKISTREKVFVETVKREIERGRIIFAGDIFDRKDIRKCSAGEAIGFQKLQGNMDWLIKGVRIVGN